MATHYATRDDISDGEFQSPGQVAVERRGAGGVERRPRRSAMADARLARALGWFSLGLGAAEVVAPRRVARLIGMADHSRNRALLQAFGLREIASGVGILAQPQRPAWLWARVGGDAMDLAVLGAAATADGARRNRLAMAAAAVAGVAALDVYCGQRLSRHAGAGAGTEPRAIELTEVITVNRAPEELYQFWRELDNLPRIMDHLESVDVKDDTRSHWVAKGPAGSTVEWDAEIVEDRVNELIAWRSVAGADVDNAGSVQFTPAPGGRGTEVRVELRYTPPAGAAGAAFAKLFGKEPGQQINTELRRFKQLMETGEITTAEGPRG